MIETLNGFYETVNCKQQTSLKLYNNEEFENYPPHWHTHVEIIMPTENIYTLNCTNQEIRLREYDIIIVCPGCIHSITAPPSGKRIIFQPNLSNFRFIRENDVLVAAMSPFIVITPEEYPDIHEPIKNILLNIRDEYEKSAAFSEIDLYSKLLCIISLIGKNYSYIAEKNNDKEKKAVNQEEYIGKFMEICDYINDHCSEDLKLDDIAAKSGFSKYYFERLFKQYAGTSFYKYVNQRRIAMAEQLLVEPSNSVTDVAINCGFSSISSFIRMFKIIKGCTPTEFKDMYWNYV